MPTHLWCPFILILILVSVASGLLECDPPKFVDGRFDIRCTTKPKTNEDLETDWSCSLKYKSTSTESWLSFKTKTKVQFRSGKVECDFRLPVDLFREKSPGEFYVKATFMRTRFLTTATESTIFRMTMSLPVPWLQKSSPSIDLVQGYLRPGVKVNFTCGLSNRGFPPGRPIWFINGTATPGLPQTISVNISDAGTKFACRARSILRLSGQQVPFSPKFVEGPKQVVASAAAENQTASPSKNVALCSGFDLDLHCMVRRADLTPDALLSIVVITPNGLSHMIDENADDVEDVVYGGQMVKRFSHTLPSSRLGIGFYAVNCIGRNSIFPDVSATDDLAVEVKDCRSTSTKSALPSCSENELTMKIVLASIGSIVLAVSIVSALLYWTRRKGRNQEGVAAPPRAHRDESDKQENNDGDDDDAIAHRDNRELSCRQSQRSVCNTYNGLDETSMTDTHDYQSTAPKPIPVDDDDYLLPAPGSVYEVLDV